jgi:glycosyltransferase involved in cell wall biosynthesis
VDDADALSGALRGWVTDDALRRRLRTAARSRRPELADWFATGRRVARVLEGAAA